mmetsp:Transcript_70098/g.217749  ORF Transcript_70098/g.217749 Transcript_70098/m.217749 type:complete len:415 (-) Transcript_70098:66-1310(-)
MAAENPTPAAAEPATGAAPQTVAGARPFLVERFFARHEFTAEYMLGSSDAESWTVRELLELAASRGDTAATREWEEVHLGYTESPGHPELRRAAAELYGGPIGPDQVLCVVPEEGIFLSMTALLAPGDAVVAMAPAYQSLHEVARAKGCTVHQWRATYEATAGWSFSLATLREVLAAAGKGVRMLVVNVPHNPTSWMPTPAEHAELVSICEERGLLLFSDEMYWGLAPTEDGPPVSGCRRYNRAITLSGLSKPYGMPGLRVGWLATQDAEVMAKLRHLKDYTTICGSAPSEILAIIALRHGEALLARARETTARNREHLAAFCAEFSDLFEWAPKGPQGVCIFVMLRGWAARMGSAAFAEWCVSAASCVLVPSESFEEPTPAVRVGVGRKNFPEALARLRTHLLAARDGPEGPA